jgi:hypothetical protein
MSDLQTLLKLYQTEELDVWKVVKNTSAPNVFTSAFENAMSKTYKFNTVTVDTIGFMYASKTYTYATWLKDMLCEQGPDNYSIIKCKANVLHTPKYPTVIMCSGYFDSYYEFWHNYKNALRNAQDPLYYLRKSSVQFVSLNSQSNVLCASVKPLYSVW